jgi:phosphopantetheinyl transferase
VIGRQLALRWCGVPDEVSREDLAVLDERGQDRAAAITHEGVRVRHVTAWALLRRLLAELEGGDPRDVHLTADPDGRPTTGTRTSVSISHARDLVVVAVCLDGTVGVDVERRDRQPLPTPSAWCSPAEVAVWSTLPTSDRPLWQLRTWTAKEATFKACGAPCSTSHRPARVRWFDPTGEHIVALASRADSRREPWTS